MRTLIIWGAPVLALLAAFWLSLFCYSAIPISPVSALHALFPSSTPPLSEALVRNLRLPRSLVALLIGAALPWREHCCKP